MFMSKRVSIIIPVYNVKKYLCECLDSVITQDYQNIEIVLINDGSFDGSEKICLEYARRDNRIKFINQKNKGAANAKNAGIDQATGQYITFMDSDDFAEKNWISTMVQMLEISDADVVECNFDKVFVDRSEKEEYVPEKAVFSGEQYMKQYLEQWTSSLFWNKLYKIELTKEIRFRKERRCIDDEFYTYKILTKANKVIRINQVLYHYRQRKSSAVWNQKNRQQITDDVLEVLIERYEWIRECYPKLRRAYLCHDIDIMFFFAKNFSFTEETVCKFKKIARYYLKECMKCNPGKIGIINVVKLQKIKKDYLMKEKTIENISEKETFN